MTRPNLARAARHLPSRLAASAASFAAVAASALLFVSTDVRAATPADSVPNIAVQYSSDAVGTPADAKVLYRKLKVAARRVCGLDGGRLNLQQNRGAHLCYQETLAKAVHDIDRPLLTSLHEGAADKVG